MITLEGEDLSERISVEAMWLSSVVIVKGAFRECGSFEELITGRSFRLLIAFGFCESGEEGFHLYSLQ